MLFNSLDFAIFLPIVFTFYWLINKRSLKLQNALVLAASYLFYGWWDWRFLSLIIFSTIVDFYVAKHIHKSDINNRRSLLLLISIFVNLGFLGVFKYYNFFVHNFIEAFSLFGLHFNQSSLNIVLPVGISFYTFQTMSYTIDVYKRKMEPTNDFIAFSAYVAFFPQLVAGPIERAKNLIPQFLEKRNFDYKNSVDGLRQILWGLFKKVVIADNAAEFVNIIFNNPSQHTGSTLVLGAVLFAFQIYGDFSGYSDIAIGTARLFGFNLMRNFAFPYFSRDIAEFWRRWHISLSSWFRDYLYIPLGGSRGGLYAKIRNTFIIFLVSGFWHGANWTFIVWGALNAVYFLPLLLSQQNRNHIDIVAKDRHFPNLKEAGQILFTFLITCLAWIFFRANNVNEAVIYVINIFDKSLFTIPIILPKVLLLLILFFLLIEWMGRRNEYALEKLFFNKNRIVRWAFYCLIIFMIGMYAKTSETPFIYFQF